MYSLDGKTWSAAVTNPLNVTINGVAWNGAMWVATGTNSFATINTQYSIDGIHWYPAHNPCMAYGGNKLAARQLLPYPSRIGPAIPMAALQMSLQQTVASRSFLEGSFVARGQTPVMVSAPEILATSVVVLTRMSGITDILIPPAYVVSIVTGRGFTIVNTDDRDKATYNYRILE
jgi:hypothetical protein